MTRQTPTGEEILAFILMCVALVAPAISLAISLALQS